MDMELDLLPGRTVLTDILLSLSVLCNQVRFSLTRWTGGSLDNSVLQFTMLGLISS